MRRCVVKPATTNFGIGIHFIPKNSPYAWREAIHACFKLSGTVVAETFIQGKEYRFLVIGNAVNGIVYREPANIIGDGISRIKNLVQAKNENPNYYRFPYFLKLEKFELNFLKAQGLTPTSILPQGKKIYLRENSNISTGGDSIDVTDSVPNFFHSIALKSAKACGAKICGVDMIIPSFSGQNYAIIELNYNPAIFFHSVPFQGKDRDPGSALLKLFNLI
ncbi:hypothetical protein COB21_05220 [Candidatus Aerophobetes bacterium]|uniref:ATP-grasp domain-containing protein n=1 Tax=Aerophobetes bacterium TaxID=2030807 RepID=A0A2A4X0I1_UNCAE|nr:MAG: hypothetical protein COB21_05220 [Candidatus Aerophobetes bacterium]